MRNASRLLSLLLLGAAWSLPVITTGCADHHAYRVYDPTYRDYHPWNADEDAYYRRWEAEEHREHREFRERPAEEQKRYWDWRHSHNDRDHDRDHDRH